MRSSLFAAATLALVCGGPARATDNLIPGKITIVKDTKLFKVVAKDPLKIPFTLPGIGSGGDPTVGGGDGNVEIIDTGSAGTLTDPLTAGGWTGLGNPAGSTGYKYKNLNAPAGGAVKIIIVKEKVIKIVAKDDGTLNGPVAGNVGIILSLGITPDRYCAEFGGTTLKNELGLVKRKDAPAPATCPGIAPCCNGDGFLNFTVAAGSGDCGDVLNDTGLLVQNINCGGYYVGGGGNSIPLPYPAPDLTSPVTAITSCAGQVATVGATTSTQTGSDRNCTSAGCLFGAPVPVPNGSSPPTSICVVNALSAATTGSVNCTTGVTNLAMPLLSVLFLTGDSLANPGIQPCPLCSAGSCIGGANNGMTCVAQTTTLGGNPAYPTSQDCPPSSGLNIGTLPIAFALSSGTVSWTGTVPTNDTGSTVSGQTRVFSGYCRDSDGTGVFQGPAHQCWENGMAVGAACVGTFETCEQRNTGAFGPNGGANKTITAIGSSASIIGGAAPAKLASVFTVPPTVSNPSFDGLWDLPGPGAVVLSGSLQTCAVATACP